MGVTPRRCSTRLKSRLKSTRRRHVIERSAFGTSGLSYSRLVGRAAELDAQIKAATEERKAILQDVFARRVDMIRRGKQLPGAEVLRPLLGWADQERREQRAHAHRRLVFDANGLVFEAGVGCQN
jgi:hypothetical protein